MIELKDIHKSFGPLTVLNGLSLQVNDGEMLAIVGKSGAGKTTLLQIMGTLEKPSSGSVLYDGVDVSRLSEKELSDFRNQHIGFIFQFHQLLPEFTALENVMLPALINGHLPNALQRATELLTHFGLHDRLSHKPAELSGGEKQRIAAARAMMMHPKVILADEPSGSLDKENKADMHNLLCELRDKYGQTVVVVTHDRELAQLADRIIEL